MAPEKVPDRVLVLDELPRGPAGKVVMQELRVVIERISESEEATPHGDQPIESQVIRIAASALGLPAEYLSLTANSESTKNWDSLSHLKLIMALEQNFAITLSPDEVMQIRTLSDAAHVVREKTAAQNHLEEGL